jgi:hypothetical protein
MTMPITFFCQSPKKFLATTLFCRQTFQNPDDSGIWFDSDAIIDR